MLSWKGWVLIGGAGGSWVGGGDGCAGVGGGGWLRNSAAAGATAASFSPGQIKMGPNAWKFQPNQNAKTSFTFDLFKQLYMIVIRQICWCPSRSIFLSNSNSSANYLFFYCNAVGIQQKEASWFHILATNRILVARLGVQI